MRHDAVATLVETHITQANGDVVEGRRTFARQMDEMILTEGLTLEHVNLSSLFEALVNREGAIDIGSPVNVCESMFAAGLPGLVGKLLHPVFMQGYDPEVEDALPLVTQTTTKKSKEEIGGLTAHDMPQLTREGAPYESSQQTEKIARIENHKFGITVNLSIEAVTEDQTGQMIVRARELGVKGGSQIHAYIVQKVTDIACSVTGEPAGRSLFIKGAARDMYADSHASWDDGIVNDNLAASTVLADTGLDTARLLLAGMRDEKGDPVRVRPRFLIVPDALWKIATQLITSLKVVGSNQNEPNVSRGLYKVVSSPYLDIDSTGQWYLGDPARQSRIQWYWKPKTDSLGGNTQVAFERDIVAQFKFSYKAGVGSTDYRYAVRGAA